MIENLETLEEEFTTELTPGSTRNAMAEAEAKSRDLWQVPIEALHIIPGFNVRVINASYIAGINELADQILRDGFRQDKPLAGYVAQHEGRNVINVTDGHRRHEAVAIAIAKGAEIARLPVVVSAAGTTMEDLTVSLVTTNNGKELTPYELSLVVRRLTKFGWDPVEIATKIGITDRYVASLLKLASAPLEIRKMVMEERIAARTAINAIREHGEKALVFLQRAERLANARGEKRVTDKFAPGRVMKKVITKQAPVMAVAIASLRQDPAYTTLGEELRMQIERVFEALEKARQTEELAGLSAEGEAQEEVREEGVVPIVTAAIGPGEAATRSKDNTRTVTADANTKDLGSEGKPELWGNPGISVISGGTQLAAPGKIPFGAADVFAD